MPSTRLTHLNADTSWLLSHKGTNIVIDPWLRGSQTDFSAYFSRQEHVIPPSISSLNELDHVDAVVVSFEFTDHCHQETLLDLEPETPIFAASPADGKIRSWKHFKSVITIPVLSPSSRMKWLDESSSLPGGIRVFRIASSAKIDAGNLHSAVVFALPIDEGYRSIIYTPHGIHWYSDSLRNLSSLSPPIKHLALLHGTHEVINPWYLGGRVNLGVRNGLEVARLLGATWWICTHDEDKKAEGFVRRVLQRKIRGFGDIAGETEGIECKVLSSGEAVDLC